MSLAGITAPSPQQTEQPDTNVKPAVEATKEKEELLSPKFAALARKEKAIRQKALEIQAKEKALAEKESKYQSDYIPKSRVKEDLVGLINETGLDVNSVYNQLSDQILNQPTGADKTLIELQREIRLLKEARDTDLKNQQYMQQQQYDNAKKQISNEVKILVSDGEDFETIRTMGQEDAVVDLIEQTFNETGELLTAAQAAKEIEEYLLEEALKVASLKKLQARMKPSEPAAPVETPEKRQVSPTLSNRLTQETLPTGNDAKSRKARAIAAFNGQKI